MPTPDQTALRVEGASKRFGRIEALAGLSLAVARGEWVGLLGPNGAGKSTLMLSILGLVKLDGGRVEVLGDGSGSNRAVGFVPQELALYPLLSAEENLTVFGRLHGVRGRDLAHRVDWALEWTGLSRRARDPVSHFSGGMQRRINIACGVLHRPKLVLLDEPTVGVDPQGRQRIWTMLEELRAGGAALVQSTHELHEIETVCDRMLIMDHGRVIASGSVEQLVEGTLGSGAELRLTLDRPAEGLLPANGFEVTGATLRGALGDVGADLPAVLEKLRSAGLGVLDVHVERPGLEAVFTHLTGRELRE